MPELLEYAHNLGLKVVADTNGLILSSKGDLLERVASYISRLGIPLDGPIATINDEMRVMGAFDKCIKLLEMSKNKEYDVKINTVVTRKNYDTVPDLVDVIANYRIARWSLDQFLPVERGREYRTEYELPQASYEETVEKTKRRVNERKLTVTITGGTRQQKSRTVLLFSPQGVAYVPVQDTKQYIASIRNTSLYEIIKASELDVEKHQDRYREYERK